MATKASSAASGAAYEEQRRKRVLENLKHMEDLGISEMSKSLLQAARLQKQNKVGVRTSPKARKKFDATEVRRSSRARATVSYKDDFGELDTFLRRKRRSGGRNTEQGREYTGRVSSYEQQQRAFRRAEKLQDGLDPNNPSFVKTMVRSHVSSCFWLENLPPREFRMVLEDEDGVEFDAVYIGNRTGLSGGWRGFAMHHNLEDGDSLVFELAEHDRFKIYIIKAIDDDAEEGESDDKNAIGGTKEEPAQEDSPDTEPPKGAKRRKLRGRR
ncbi:B3 domain-containing protein [Dichanthelium oligosanthes]|uniref:B3 domain-containing protein n=1 Tax=Dichanthelium oligosanthes TaxID=888268 RepID=A0A1E5W5X7_9POAL|nr:B3 domain-containing protein [Dichanthelium oligosanthes]